MDAKDIAMYEAMYHACRVRGMGRNVKVEVLRFFEQSGREAIVSDGDCKVHEVT